jgi:hypothetical protein
MNAVFWDMAPCRSYGMNRRFRGTSVISQDLHGATSQNTALFVNWKVCRIAIELYCLKSRVVNVQGAINPMIQSTTPTRDNTICCSTETAVAWPSPSPHFNSISVRFAEKINSLYCSFVDVWGTGNSGQLITICPCCNLWSYLVTGTRHINVSVRLYGRSSSFRSVAYIRNLTKHFRT